MKFMTIATIVLIFFAILLPINQLLKQRNRREFYRRWGEFNNRISTYGYTLSKANDGVYIAPSSTLRFRTKGMEDWEMNIRLKEISKNKSDKRIKAMLRSLEADCNLRAID